MKQSLILTAFSLLVLAQLSLAQVPQTISYQGVLRDKTTGDIVEDDDYDITFTLYDAWPSAVWSETHSVGNGNPVTVANGLFSVILGKVTTLSNLTAPPVELGIKVGADEELSPRIELTSVLYSLMSTSSATAGAVVGNDNVFPGDGSVGIGTITPDATVKLEVAGDVKANSLTLPATMRYYSIPTVAFTPYPGANKLFITDIAPAGGTPFNLTAPVNLPHGAFIKELTAYIYDASATEDIAVYLRASYHHNEYPTGLRTFTKSTLAGNDIISDTSVDYTVNNLQYNYWIEVVWRSPVDPEPSDGIKFRNILIGYTVTSPLP